MIETDVLVVGCGPGGLMAAMALARQGVRVLAVTKHRHLAPTPRAHVTNQRSFEIFRDFGIEAQAMASATGYAQMPDAIFLRSLVGEEFGRVRGLGMEAGAASAEVSPCALADLPQHLLEPILFSTAVRLGAEIFFATELIEFEQDEEGVTACLHDRQSNQRTCVRARYMIGADGSNSRVAEALELPFEGPGEIGGSINVLFDCDLSPYLAYRPGLLFYFLRAAQGEGATELGILRCIKPWSSWLMIKGYAPGQATPRLTHAEAAEFVRDFLGVPALDVQVNRVDPWTMKSSCATSYHRGRVFCVGDAVHRHVPSNGLGSNTAMQDAYNLAWKLDLVMKGSAGDALLASYSDERVPVGRRVVERATRSLQSYAPILEVVGGTVEDLAKSREPGIDDPGVDTSIGVEPRSLLRTAIGKKVYEFCARGVELNHFYRSSAVLDEGQRLPDTELDLELHCLPTTCPGAHLPHAWVQRDGHRLSTLDLVGQGRFTILTGVGGDAWIKAADAAALRFGIDVAAFAIGPGCAVTDLYFEWAERREIADDGCLLVRPDGHIAWRCHATAGAAADARLTGVFKGVLGLRLLNAKGVKAESDVTMEL